MPADPINVDLNSYYKLQILRKQLEERAREYSEIDSTIREILLRIKEVEYLKSLSPAYASLDATEEQSQVTILDARRNELFDLIHLLEKTIPELEQEAKKSGSMSGASQASASSAPKIERNKVGGDASSVEPKPLSEKKPLSFDDFRKKFPSSGV